MATILRLMEQMQSAAADFEAMRQSLRLPDMTEELRAHVRLNDFIRSQPDLTEHMRSMTEAAKQWREQFAFADQWREQLASVERMRSMFANVVDHRTDWPVMPPTQRDEIQRLHDKIDRLEQLINPPPDEDEEPPKEIKGFRP